MAKFVQIGSEILNLDLVTRVERGDATENQPAILVYFVGDVESSRTRYVGPQAEAVWRQFVALAQPWNLPPSAGPDSPPTARAVEQVG